LPASIPLDQMSAQAWVCWVSSDAALMAATAWYVLTAALRAVNNSATNGQAQQHKGKHNGIFKGVHACMEGGRQERECVGG
jgi:hypothetical protein